MDLPDEREKDFSEIQPKTRHISISRKDTMMNDLKNSTAEGIVSFILSLIGLAVLILGIYTGYAAAGNAGVLSGIFPLIALILSVESVLLGIFGLKRRNKIRHYMERRGIIIGLLVILSCTLLFIWGARLALA